LTFMKTWEVVPGPMALRVAVVLLRWAPEILRAYAVGDLLIPVKSTALKHLSIVAGLVLRVIVLILVLAASLRSLNWLVITSME